MTGTNTQRRGVRLSLIRPPFYVAHVLPIYGHNLQYTRVDLLRRIPCFMWRIRFGTPWARRLTVSYPFDIYRRFPNKKISSTPCAQAILVHLCLARLEKKLRPTAQSEALNKTASIMSPGQQPLLQSIVGSSPMPPRLLCSGFPVDF